MDPRSLGGYQTKPDVTVISNLTVVMFGYLLSAMYVMPSNKKKPTHSQ